MTIKIPVLKYTEVTDVSELNGVTFGSDRYVITEDNGKQYIVEVWS